MITNINQLDLKATYTYADYLTWRLEEIVELIKGKLYIMSPAPASYHQKISGKIFGEMYTYFKNHPCNLFSAPFDVRLIKEKKENNNIYTVVQPDICVICDDEKIDEKGCIGSPDLIVEIVSPSSIKKDYAEKYDLYQENGVKEYWIINPDAFTLHQYFLNEKNVYEEKEIFIKKGTLTSFVFPELTIDIPTIFN
jgi:Uma2 family endonuclease